MINFLYSIIKNFFLAIFTLYKFIISPILPCSCRFLPSCSEYAHDSFKIHGIFKGSLLTFKRLCKCHPWGDSGFDPVPIKIKNK